MDHIQNQSAQVIKLRPALHVPAVYHTAEVLPETRSMRERDILQQFRRWFMGSNEDQQAKAAFLRQFHEFGGGV